MIWFSSDFHLGHKNIIQYDNRPFQTIEEMDDCIINNVNQYVKREDVFYFLGDFAFGKKSKVVEYRERIDCATIHFILGNHDKVIGENKNYFWGYFASIQDMLEIKSIEPRIILCHYAMKVWNKSHRGTWHLYGHSHGSLPEDDCSLSFDVGINCNNYKPLSIKDVEKRMLNKIWKPVDHHG